MPACDARLVAYSIDTSSNGSTFSKSDGSTRRDTARGCLLMSWMTPMTWSRAEIIGTVIIERVW